MARRKPPAPPIEPPPKKNRRVRQSKPDLPVEPGPSARERLRGSLDRGRAAFGKLKRPLDIAFRSVLVIAVGGGAIALGRLVERHVRTSPAFAVTEIAVEGHVRVTEDDVLERAGLSLGQNVFDVSPEEVQARLARHPWIAEAHVERRLPGSYTIEIRERRAIALLALGDVYLVAEDGTVFKRAEGDDPVDLPVITGVDRARFTADRAFRTSILLEAVALLHDYRGAGLWRREALAELHVESDDGLSLTIGEDALYVRLGRGPFRAKLGRLRTVLDELGRRGARAEYVYLDNERRPDRVTVRVREPEPIVAQEPASDS
jgi:cell division protein FtsQ